MKFGTGAFPVFNRGLFIFLCVKTHHWTCMTKSWNWKHKKSPEHLPFLKDFVMRWASNYVSCIIQFFSSYICRNVNWMQPHEVSENQQVFGFVLKVSPVVTKWRREIAMATKFSCRRDSKNDSKFLTNQTNYNFSVK